MATYFNSQLIMITMCALSVFFQQVASKRYKCKCACDQCHKPSECCELVCLNYCVQNPLAVIYVPYPIPILLPKETCEEEESCEPNSDGTAETSTPEETTVVSNTPIIQITTRTPINDVDIVQKINRLLIMIRKTRSTFTTTTSPTKKATKKTTTKETTETTEPTTLTTSELPTITTISTLTTPQPRKTTPKPSKTRPPKTTKTPKIPQTTPSEDTETTTDNDICKDVLPCIPRDLISDLNTIRPSIRFNTYGNGLRPTRKRQKNSLLRDTLHKTTANRAINSRTTFRREILRLQTKSKEEIKVARTLEHQTKSTVGIGARNMFPNLGIPAHDTEEILKLPLRNTFARNKVEIEVARTLEYQTKSTVGIQGAKNNFPNLENPAHDYEEIPKLPLRNTFARSKVGIEVARTLEYQTKSTVGIGGARNNFGNFENPAHDYEEIPKLPLRNTFARSKVGIEVARTLEYQTKSTMGIRGARNNFGNLENPAHDYEEIPKLPLRNTFARSIRPTLHIRHKKGMLRATAYRAHRNPRNPIDSDMYRTFVEQTNPTVGVRVAKYNFANIENPENYNDEIVELPLRRSHRIIKQKRITARQDIGAGNEGVLKTSLELIDLGNELGEEFDYLLQKGAEEIEHKENAYSVV